MSTTDLSAIYPSAGTVPFRSLPEDMHILIYDFVLWVAAEDGKGAVERDYPIPRHLPLLEIPLDHLPDVPLDPCDRGEEHAMDFRKGEHPPIIVADGQLYDGRHRIWGARHRGDTESLLAIDLTGMVSPYMRCNAMGKVEPGAAMADVQDCVPLPAP